MAESQRFESADKPDAVQTLRDTQRGIRARVSVWSAGGFSAAFSAPAAKTPVRFAENPVFLSDLLMAHEPGSAGVSPASCWAESRRSQASF